MSNITIALNITVPELTPELSKAINNLALALTQPQQLAQITKPEPAPAPALTLVQPPTPVQTQTSDPAAAPTNPAAAAPNPVPTTAQTYSMDQLAVAATQLVDAGRRTELVALLGQFGVQALTALPKEQYGNFATQLRAMGAKL